MVIHDNNSKSIYGRKLVNPPVTITAIDKAANVPVPFRVSSSGDIGGADSQYDFTIDGDYMVITWNTVGADPSLYSINPNQFVYINNTALNAGNSGRFIITETGQVDYSETPSGYMKMKNPNAVEESGVILGDTSGVFALYDSLPKTGSRVLIKLDNDFTGVLYVYSGHLDYAETSTAHGFELVPGDGLVELPIGSDEDLYYMVDGGGVGSKFSYWVI